MDKLIRQVDEVLGRMDEMIDSSGEESGDTLEPVEEESIQGSTNNQSVEEVNLHDPVQRESVVSDLSDHGLSDSESVERQPAPAATPAPVVTTRSGREVKKPTRLTYDVISLNLSYDEA